MTLLSRKSSIALGFASKRLFGVVLDPVSILYTRFTLAAFCALVMSVVQRLTFLDPRVRGLVELVVSIENGCSFCADLHAFDHKKRITPDELAALVSGDYCAFRDRERVAIEASKAWLQGRASHKIESELGDHFSEHEIARLVWLTASVSYFNLQSSAFQFQSHGISRIEFDGDHG